MNFKPGDKVWVKATVEISAGTHPAVILGHATAYYSYTGFPLEDLWAIDIEGIPPNSAGPWLSYEPFMTPRFDPPPQQEPKQQREPVGEWELCPWRPAKVAIKRVYPAHYVIDNIVIASSRL